jgi:hypothetical protein
MFLHLKKKTLVAVLPVLGGLLLAGATACSGGDSDIDSGSDAVTAVDTTHPLNLSDDDRRAIIQKKATCPFVGTALALKRLFVFGSTDKPLARIMGLGSAGAIGDTGGGNLSLGFQVVARADHGFDPRHVAAPVGMFSLEFPATQGVHFGHSYILTGDPKTPNSGRLNTSNLQRLIGQQGDGGHAESADDGTLVVRRSQLGKFVAQNVACDPKAVTGGLKQILLMGKDLAALAADTAEAVEAQVDGTLQASDDTKIRADLERLLANDNDILKASGEYGLLTMLLAPSPNARTINGEPALSVEDIENIFVGKRDANGNYDPLTRTFPPNWESTPKTLGAVFKHTIMILHTAAIATLAGEFTRDSSCPDMN